MSPYARGTPRTAPARPDRGPSPAACARCPRRMRGRQAAPARGRPARNASARRSAGRRARRLPRYAAPAARGASARPRRLLVEIGIDEDVVAERDLHEVLDLLLHGDGVGHLHRENDRCGLGVTLLDFLVLRGALLRVQLFLADFEQFVDALVLKAGPARLADRIIGDDRGDL